MRNLTDKEAAIIEHKTLDGEYVFRGDNEGGRYNVYIGKPGFCFMMCASFSKRIDVINYIIDRIYSRFNHRIFERSCIWHEEMAVLEKINS